jgi:ribose-phosphate pyrophosphokinase
MTMDLHAGQIQGFFDIPTDNLFAVPVLLRDMQKIKGEQITVVSPDVGGVVRARSVAQKLGAGLAIIDKRRQQAGHSEVMHIIGEVENKVCILVDDIVDSASTLCNAADSLKSAGAVDVYAYITHGVLSGEALKRINSSKLKELVITDTIQPTEQTAQATKVRILSIAPLMAEAIRRTNIGESVSSLFDG